MITPLVMSTYISKTAFKLSSDVKQVSIEKMDVKLNSSIFEKDAPLSSESSLSEANDDMNFIVEMQSNYQKTFYRDGLEFYHEHLLDVII